MALLTPHWGRALDGISSDGSPPKGLLSIQFLTKAELCDGSLFDPKQNRGRAALPAVLTLWFHGDDDHSWPPPRPAPA